jgi:hypothetical protein
MVFGEAVHRFFGKSWYLFVEGHIKFVEEVFGQKGNIFPSLPKRGNGDRDHIEPEVEILPKASFGNGFLKVGVAVANGACNISIWGDVVSG